MDTVVALAAWKKSGMALLVAMLVVIERGKLKTRLVLLQPQRATPTTFLVVALTPAILASYNDHTRVARQPLRFGAKHN